MAPKSKVAKPLKFMAAGLAILIIAGLLVFMISTLIQKASDLTGLEQNPVTTINCTDTDGGNLQQQFGTCTDSTRQSKSDTCVLTGLQEALKLQEWFCNTTTNTCKSEIKTCDPGFVCAGGMCVGA